MAEIGSAFVSILPSARGFGSKLNSEVSGQVSSSGSSLGKTFGKLFALSAGVIAAAGIGNLLKGSIDEAREAQKVGAATEAIIKATGGAARITAEDVGAMAGRLSAVTGIDDEAIQSGSNLLLTFKNVKNFVGGEFTGTFDRATAAAVDLSAAGFGSIESASKTVGKALNDPIKGVSALSRAGVTFTEQQKEQIKTLTESGDVLGAQNIILKEVEGQVGGVAAATATSGEKASVAFGNIKESIGTALLPAIDAAANAFVKFAPAVQKGIGNIGPIFQKVRTFLEPFIASIAAAVLNLGTQLAPTIATIASAIGTFVGQIQSGTGAGGAFVSIISGLASALGTVFGFISANQAVVGTFVGIIAAAALAAKAFAAAQLLVNLALAANPIGIVVVAIAALAAGIVYAYKNSETFRNGVDALGRVFKKVFSSVVKIVGVALNFIRAHWRTLLVILGGPIGLAVALISKHFDKIKAGAGAVVGWIKSNWPAIKALVTGPFETARTVIGKVWTALRQGASRVKDVVLGVFNAIKGAIQGAIDKAQQLIDKLNSVKGAGKGVKGGSGGKDDLGRVAGRSVAEGIAGGITARGDLVVNSLDGLFKQLGKKAQEKLKKFREQLSTVRDDFASLVDPIASNFTQSLFDFDNAGAFTTNLTTVKGTLATLLSNFKTLIADGLSPGFLYQLFESGGPGLINSLAGLPKADALAAGSLFGEVTNLSNQLGTAVAGSTAKGAELETQTARLEKKLEKLEKSGKDNTRELVDALTRPAANARRRARTTLVRA